MDPRQFASTGNWSPADRTNLFVVERGADRKGPPLVFLHGIPTWSWLWRNVLPVTARAARSVAIDLPGFGLSDRSPWQTFSVPSMAATLHAVLDRIAGSGAPVAVACHDFGALVAAEMIHQQPGRIARLVITNTSLRAHAWGGGGPLRILGAPLLGDLSMMLARRWMLRVAMTPFVADECARTPDVVAGYWYPFEAGFGRALARLYRERPVQSADFDRWRSALAGFSSESLILWGERDPAFTLDDATDIVDLLPNSRYLGFQNASHFLPEERPKAVGRGIAAFLTGTR